MRSGYSRRTHTYTLQLDWSLCDDDEDDAAAAATDAYTASWFVFLPSLSSRFHILRTTFYLVRCTCTS